MGRIRTIKPEILEDDKTANLPHLEWRLFVSLFVLADDYGNLRGEPAYIQGAALWALVPDVDRNEIEAALDRLNRDDLVCFYRVRGQLYLHITGWDKHQKVDKPGKPRVPGLDEQDAQRVPPPRRNSRDSRETLAPDPDPDPDQDHEGEATSKPSLVIPKPTHPEALERTLQASTTELAERQKLRTAKWQKLEAIRSEIARELGVEIRPLAAQDPGERSLAMRIREAPDLRRADADVEHVLAIYAAEARSTRSVQWLTGAMFEERSWRRALGMTAADASTPKRAGPRASPPEQTEIRRIKTL